MTRLISRLRVAVVLSLVLATSWPAKAAPRGETVSSPNVVVAVKGWLNSLWAAAGCILDPNGRCLPTGPTADNGCIGDPDGIRCVSGAAVSAKGGASPTTDNGCIFDPDGKCRTGQ